MIVRHRGYTLYHCKPFGGIINHGFYLKHATQVACWYWQIRKNGKLIDTALTQATAKRRIDTILNTRKLAA